MQRILPLLGCLLLAFPAWGQASKALGREFRELGEQISAASQAGDLDRAEELSRRRVGLVAGGPDRMVGNAYRNLGNVLRQRGKLREAEDMLRKAQPLIENDNGRLSHQAIRCLFSLAGLLSAQSRFAEADAVAREALARQEAYRPAAIDAITARNMLASVQRALGRLDAADALLKAAAALEVSSEAEGQGDNNFGPYWLGKRRAETRFQQAQVDLQRGRLAEAEADARQALQEFSALAGEAHPDTVSALAFLGSVILRQERHAEAEPVLRQAAERAARAWGRFSVEKAKADFSLALCLSHLRRGEAAEPYYRQALEAARGAGALNVVAHVAQGYARTLEKRGRLKEALVLEREALDAVDRLFAQTRGLDEATRENFIVQYGAYYFETIELLLQLHRQSPAAGHDREALAVVSRTQSRLFTEMLRQADAGRLGAEAEFRALQARERTLQAELAAQRQARALLVRENYGEEGGERAVVVDDAIVQSRIDERRQRMDAALATSATALEQVEGSLWSRYPRYMELTQPRPVTVELLQQQLLKPGETLLTYFLLPTRALAFVVSRERFRLVDLPLSREEATALVRAARQPEEAAGEGLDNLARLDPALLHRLYGAIFQPLETDLNGERPVLVIGDGALHTLPLEMLVTRYGEAEKKVFAAARAKHGAALAEYATLPYLGQRYRFSYLPSLSALASVRLYRKPAGAYGRDLVSFADPLFDFTRGAPASARLEMATRSLMRRGGLSIPRLPETADEAREIAAVVGGRSEIFLREKAQEHTVKSLDLKSTRYLHFATHGLLGGEFVEISKALAAEQRPASEVSASEQRGRAAAMATRGEPALLLSLSGDLAGEDGLLTMGEIVQSLDLNARLVVLSACNTAGEGSQAAASGEGFAGLTRAFMYAGAQGLMVSHWSVESQATQQLMAETFRGLGQGADPLAALDQARSMIRGSTVDLDGETTSRAHPYFWAPFVYVGD